MDCIIEFLSDKNQKDLRRLAQNQSECYEETLEMYKKLFISYFLQIKKQCKNDKCDISNKCYQFKSAIKEIEVKNINMFFDNMKNVYINWIDAKVQDALELFNKTMDDYKLWDFYDDEITKDIFFKGRVDKNILTKWEMFHIPFNKRYLIKNQRYSLTGQPIIYLGKSILDIIKELDIDESNSKNLKISSVRINNTLRVYDLRNDILRVINKREFFDIVGGADHINNFEQEFYKMLLSSICSFERRKEHKDYTFCEEYVLPQILAQTLKNKDYDGILYYSTKKFGNIEFENTADDTQENTVGDSKVKIVPGIQLIEINKNKFKENVALFTNFNKEHVYDENLYNKMEISSPINFYKVQNFNVKDLEDICDKIEVTGNQQDVSKSQVIVEIYKREFGNMIVNKKKYKDMDIGKLHIYYLYCILNQILCECVR